MGGAAIMLCARLRRPAGLSTDRAISKPLPVHVWSWRAVFPRRESLLTAASARALGSGMTGLVNDAEGIPSREACCLLVMEYYVAPPLGLCGMVRVRPETLPANRLKPKINV